MPHDFSAAYTTADFAVSPLMFYYEVTLACDLVCKHCRALAQSEPSPDELSTDRAMQLLDQAASFPRKPTLVFTGGDPLKRPDLLELIRHAAAVGLHPALTPSATPLATREAFEQVREAGIRHLGISLDAADAATHDAFRGVEGSFERTIQMLDFARELKMPVQVNTTVTRRNFLQLDAIAELLAAHGIAMWSVFFLVPVGRGIEEQRISPAEYERVFEQLWRLSQRMPFAIKTTEAPQYRRFVLQHGGDPLAGPGENGVPPLGTSRAKNDPTDQHCLCQAVAHNNAAGQAGSGTPRKRRAPLGVWDGRGVMFVNHAGEIFPAGFLPLCCGRFPQDSVVETYQKHPTFLALRNPDSFHGSCGICDFRQVCGGSRSRAFALTGDFLATDPDCEYGIQLNQ